MSSATDKAKGAANEAIGKAKQGVGKAVGSDRMKGEGALQEAKGDLQQAPSRRRSTKPDEQRAGRHASGVKVGASISFLRHLKRNSARPVEIT